ncbi:serine hydrolase [Devosia albogilva]|uniref:Serine hydrolase n=1 Tax=Devosia albogilva TaxID=429726 RepID=A0ABW5QJG0_9HYPH
MRHWTGLLAATLMLTAPVAAEEVDVDQILTDRITRDLANIGIAVAVIEDGDTRFHSAGTLAVDSDQPVDEHTVFEAGSIGKLFTNILVAQEVLAGTLELDAPVIDYLPDGTTIAGGEGDTITVFDLATHHSGLTGLPPKVTERGIDNPYAGSTAEELVAWLAETELNRPVGESFEYSNAGLALLGQVLEQVTGTPYAELVETRIFEVLGMDESSIGADPAQAERLATGHDAAREPVGNWEMDAFNPAGGLRSTAADLAKFAAAASGATETPLAEAFALMFEQTRPTGDAGETIGLGWFVTPDDKIAWHNGITAGYRSFLGFRRDTGKAVVVLSNMVTEAGIEDIGLHILDPEVPLREQPKPREMVEIDPAILDAYIGEYLLAPGIVITVTAEDGRLFAQLTGQQRFEIFPESERRFFFRIVEAQITFGEPEEGRSPALVLHQNGMNQTAVRVK